MPSTNIESKAWCIRYSKSLDTDLRTSITNHSFDKWFRFPLESCLIFENTLHDITFYAFSLSSLKMFLCKILTACFEIPFCFSFYHIISCNVPLSLSGARARKSISTVSSSELSWEYFRCFDSMIVMDTVSWGVELLLWYSQANACRLFDITCIGRWAFSLVAHLL